VTEFTVVVPVKGTPDAKSRLGGAFQAELAQALALDTVTAALAAAPVVVVTSHSAAASFERLGARVVLDPGGGLQLAIAAGLAAVLGPVAVLLGDLPSLAPEELAGALEAAARHPLSFVPDAEGTGTSMATMLGRAETAFGSGSRAAHAALGYIELDLPVSSGLRRDVDTVEQLLALPVERLGPRTAGLRARL
jgi:2-phospho-L-lactate guanylyltransferase